MILAQLEKKGIYVQLYEIKQQQPYKMNEGFLCEKQYRRSHPTVCQNRFWSTDITPDGDLAKVIYLLITEIRPKHNYTITRSYQ